MSSENRETRTRILDAAWSLLEAGGGAGVRMSDIAKAAGLSRQAVYLHFPKRAALLIAVTRHIDAVKDVDARLAASRSAASGRERLVAYVTAWGGYIPEISGVAAALMAMAPGDEAARTAWADRMAAMREGCEAVTRKLAEEGALTPGLTEETATDILWTLLSVRTWEHLTQDCGWSQAAYLDHIVALASRAVAAEPNAG